MSLIIIGENNITDSATDGELFRTVLSNNPAGKILLQGLSGKNPFEQNKTIVALPEEWKFDTKSFSAERTNHSGCSGDNPEIVSYKEGLCIPVSSLNGRRTSKWFTIKNGSFATRIDSELVSEILETSIADVVVISVKSELRAHRDRVRLTNNGRVAGFRRLYSDIVEPDFDLNTFYSSKIGNSTTEDDVKVSNFTDWPEYTFIKSEVLNKVFQNGELPASFGAFLRKCQSNKLRMQALNAGGDILNLQTESGLLDFSKSILNAVPSYRSLSWGAGISSGAKLLGKVILGSNVTLEPQAVIVGPSVICDGAHIKRNAVVNSSIIGSNVCIPEGQFVDNGLVLNAKPSRKKSSSRSACPSFTTFALNTNGDGERVYRSWSLFSYPGSIKRVLDFVTAAIILILFAPVFPFIILAIKLNSKGPAIYRDKRQGLYGKEFGCLKFRSMQIDAHELQDKLRVVNQIDGPQFKIEDDPRITAVGRFLRDTYLDELPQFFNVLLGQMSIVGPRPSPKQENNLCPSWCNARLSVRPGITGLWQVCRTRSPMRDFQEWIYYDIRYVRDLSLKLDLWIFWQTTKKLITKFIDQF